MKQALSQSNKNPVIQLNIVRTFPQLQKKPSCPQKLRQNKQTASMTPHISPNHRQLQNSTEPRTPKHTGSQKTISSPPPSHSQTVLMFNLLSRRIVTVSISLVQVARGLFLPSHDNISLACRQISLAFRPQNRSSASLFFSRLIQVVGFLLFRTWCERLSVSCL
jgi:hypothetical protein